MASLPGGRGPKSTIACTCASALSPEKSFQIFLPSALRACAPPRSQPARSRNAIDTKVDPARHARSPLFTLRQAQGTEDALQVVIPIILNLDPASFISVMKRHPRPQMLLQSILQIFDGGRRRRICRSLAAPARTTRA